jgi:hypothetical protein
MHVLAYVSDRCAKIVLGKSALCGTPVPSIFDPLQDTKSRNSKVIHLVRVEKFHEAASEPVRGIVASLFGIA